MRRFCEFALRPSLLGALPVVGIGGLVGLLVPHGWTTADMLSRTKPTLLDLAVSLASGVAAAYATARQRAARALSGVAIAVALVPPLPTVGLAAVSGQKGVTLGALLLFLTNLASIVSANALVLLWMGFHPNSAEGAHARTFRCGLLGTTILLLYVAVILGTVTVTSVKRVGLRNSVEPALNEQVAAMGPEIALVDWEIAEAQGGMIRLELLAQATRGTSPDKVAALRDILALRLRRTVLLSLTAMPVKRLDPSVGPEKRPTRTS